MPKVTQKAAKTSGAYQLTSGQPAQSVRKSGMCHSAQIGPSTNADPSGPTFRCSRGRAKSRQPGSSARPVVIICRMSPGTYATSTNSHACDGAAICPPTAWVAMMIVAGTPIRIPAYQRQLARQRHIPLTQAPRPARPPTIQVTSAALPIGPRYAPGSIPRSWPPIMPPGKVRSQRPRPLLDRTYGVQASQLAARASTKKVESWWRRTNPRRP